MFELCSSHVRQENSATLCLQCLTALMAATDVSIGPKVQKIITGSICKALHFTIAWLCLQRNGVANRSSFFFCKILHQLHTLPGFRDASALSDLARVSIRIHCPVNVATLIFTDCKADQQMDVIGRALDTQILAEFMRLLEGINSCSEFFPLVQSHAKVDQQHNTVRCCHRARLFADLACFTEGLNGPFDIIATTFCQPHIFHQLCAFDSACTFEASMNGSGHRIASHCTFKVILQLLGCSNTSQKQSAIKRFQRAGVFAHLQRFLVSLQCTIDVPHVKLGSTNAFQQLRPFKCDQSSGCHTDVLRFHIRFQSQIQVALCPMGYSEICDQQRTVGRVEFPRLLTNAKGFLICLDSLVKFSYVKQHNPNAVQQLSTTRCV
mmetsp:Transcript_132640/g.264719  ORF Transcript_132640/g.264719 Transcript_132640/m.264719 type:complete len:379 (+) Transcript_132640:2867-4003(+)